MPRSTPAVNYVGMRVHHADGLTTDCPWRFRSVTDVLTAFYELEGEDPSAQGWELINPKDEHPVWGDVIKRVRSKRVRSE